LEEKEEATVKAYTMHTESCAKQISQVSAQAVLDYTVEPGYNDIGL
jgi:hypothetical protein